MHIVCGLLCKKSISAWFCGNVCAKPVAWKEKPIFQTYTLKYISTKFGMSPKFIVKTNTSRNKTLEIALQNQFHFSQKHLQPAVFPRPNPWIRVKTKRITGITASVCRSAFWEAQIWPDDLILLEECVRAAPPRPPWAARSGPIILFQLSARRRWNFYCESRRMAEASHAQVLLSRLCLLWCALANSCFYGWSLAPGCSGAANFPLDCLERHLAHRSLLHLLLRAHSLACNRPVLKCNATRHQLISSWLREPLSLRLAICVRAHYLCRWAVENFIIEPRSMIATWLPTLRMDYECNYPF